MTCLLSVGRWLSSPASRSRHLGALFNTMGVVWLTSYALLAAHGRASLQLPRVKSALDYLSGIVLVGLGLRLALERRG